MEVDQQVGGTALFIVLFGHVISTCQRYFLILWYLMGWSWIPSKTPSTSCQRLCIGAQHRHDKLSVGVHTDQGKVQSNT